MKKPVSNQKPKKKRGKLRLSLLLCVAMLAASGYFISNVLQEASTTFSLMADISDAKKELAQLKKENETLVNEQEKLQDENYVKNYARGEYMISKEGEQIFHLPNVNGKTESEPEPTTTNE